MFPCDEKTQRLYSQSMSAIKELVKEKRDIKTSVEYKVGLRTETFRKKSFSKKIKSIINIVTKKNSLQRKATSYLDLVTAHNDRTDCNYFSDERIAVYTCIIGRYDSLQEPLIQPDNIDYYAITDFDIPKDSKWKRIDVSDFNEVKGFTPALKNRYFKINPHKIFKNYKYSIYVDGNFRICSDLTEHIHRISEYGLSNFKHSKRTCVYEEAKVCKILKKETEDNINAYVERIKKEGFPENYGLLACDILVREHHNETCIMLMEDWWSEFKNHVKRDQLSLPFVLFKHGIKPEAIQKLGGDVHKEYSFEIVSHIKK